MRRLLILVVVLGLAGCGSPSSQQKFSTPSAGPTTTVTTTTTTTPTTTTPATTTPTTVAPQPTTTTVPAPDALDQLGGFVTAARVLDAQLHTAAQAINSAGPPWPQISPSVAAAVNVASLDRLTAAIPAGLPRPLLQQTILVYSDLVSRRYAMRFFGDVGPVYDQQWLLDGLRDGAPAAARFPADLADLVALARSSAPVTVAAPTSIQAADRDLLVQYVELANGGCASTGGQVFPTLPSITWATSTSGQIGGIYFTATLAGTTWTVVLRAC